MKILGPHLATMIREYHKFGRKYFIACVDRDWNTVDWDDAKVEDEAHHEALAMIKNAESKRLGNGGPYRAIIIEITREVEL